MGVAAALAGAAQGEAQITGGGAAAPPDSGGDEVVDEGVPDETVT